MRDRNEARPSLGSTARRWEAQTSVGYGFRKAEGNGSGIAPCLPSWLIGMRAGWCCGGDCGERLPDSHAKAGLSAEIRSAQKRFPTWVLQQLRRWSYERT